MLTARENFDECRKGKGVGHPDRFVKQYEYLAMMFHPFYTISPQPMPGDENVVDAWGITRSWRKDQPGAFPVHTPDRIVNKDFEDWKEYVKAPRNTFSDAEWEPFVAKAEAVDRSKQYVSQFIAPGIFEQLHNLSEISNTLAAFYEYPDEVHEMIKFLVDWEIEMAEDTCKHIHPDAIFHHDDWGTQKSTFLSPDMWADFFLEPYKTLYGYWKEQGVQIVVHHSDSYAATLVPYMIEIGIDVWQGVMESNNIPELLQKYGNKITYMGGINSAHIDYEGWTQEVIDEQVMKACEENGPFNFVPGASQGLAMSTFPGVYEATDKAIEKVSEAYFAKHQI
ncbi:MAG: uroporphyrinogen decarboxylase family protein [Coriobacteriales bacterium]|jgi:hypothetical protein